MAVNLGRVRHIETVLAQRPGADAQNAEENLRDLLTDARHFATYKGLDYDEADRMAEIHFDAEVESEVHMVGVAVERVDGPSECGYVAHALLSDGTRSWPMGARVYDTSGPAERECLMVRWVRGGPQVEHSPLPDPPEELRDAWARFQAGGSVSESEIRKLDEWRAECAEAAGF